jgi:hypothetical protein
MFSVLCSSWYLSDGSSPRVLPETEIIDCAYIEGKIGGFGTRTKQKEGLDSTHALTSTKTKKKSTEYAFCMADGPKREDHWSPGQSCCPVGQWEE